MKPTIEQAKFGLYAQYKGSWCFISGVSPKTNEIWLSGWRGIKTTVVNIDKITDIKERNELILRKKRTEK